MYDRKYGERYSETKELFTTDIAKRIRTDIKTAIQNKQIPDIRTSVRTKYFSGGSSIDIEIVEMPFNPLNKTRIKEELDNPNEISHEDVYTAEAEQVRQFLKSIMNSYNYDGSDIMTDYFDVRFYGSVDIGFDFTEKCREQIIQELSLN